VPSITAIQVSKERITSEVTRTLAAKHGLRGAHLLHETGLLHTVLAVSEETAARGLASLAWVESAGGIGEVLGLPTSGDAAALVRLALLTEALHASSVPHPQKTSKSARPIAAAEASLMFNGMRIRSKDCTSVVVAHNTGAEYFQPLLEVLARADDTDMILSSAPDGTPMAGPVSRVQLGMALKKAGKLYPLSVAVGAVLVRARGILQDDMQLVHAARRLLTAMDILDLESVWTVPNMWNGNELQRKLGLGAMPAGSGFGDLMWAQKVWALKHPSGTKEECLVYLTEEAKNMLKLQGEE